MNRGSTSLALRVQAVHDVVKIQGAAACGSSHPAARLSRCPAESGSIIRYKFLDALRNLRALRIVPELFIGQGHPLTRPLLQDSGRNGYKIGASMKRIKQMLKIPNAGAQRQQVMVALQQTSEGCS